MKPKPFTMNRPSRFFIRLITALIIASLALTALPVIPVQAATTTTTVAPGGTVPSVELNASGNPVISYYDSANGDLKLLVCGNPTCTAGNTITTVDSGGNVGQYSSLELNASGNPVISYYDITNTHLKLAVCGNPTCTAGNTITTVDSAGNMGQWNSLKLTASGNPVISYWDSGNQDLRLAICNDPTCTTRTNSTVDTGGNTGSYTSLALNSFGYPVVSYNSIQGPGSNGLKLMVCNNAACSLRTFTFVDPGLNENGYYTSLKLRPGNLPVISYFNAYPAFLDLKLAVCNNSTTCNAPTIITVDSAGIVGSEDSMALNPSGNPVISYYDGTNRDLKLAVCNNTNCSSRTTSSVDTAGVVGRATSLALTASGYPVIAYYDQTNGALKVATITPPAIISATSTTANGSYNVPDAINITINFDENISSAAGLTINLNSGGSVTTGALTNTSSYSGTYTVGAGQNSADLTVSSITGTITNRAGYTTTNPTVPAGQNIADSKAIVIDTTAPTLTSFTRQNPATSPTNADTLVFRATFNENVQNVDATDFTVTGTTATITGVTPVSASVYDITVSGGNLAGLNGTVGLNLAGGQNITDLAGNALPTVEPATDQTYLVFNYGLGNRVWFDTNNDGLLNGAEVGASGARVELYQDNGATPGVYDAGDTFVGFQTTDASGYYRFDALPPGDYVVRIPPTQFQVGGPLQSYWSSGTSVNASGTPSDSIGPDPDNDADSDDNGVTTFTGNAVNYVSSRAVTLGPGESEPTNDNDPVTNPLAGESPNNQSNRTVDFGFYRVAVSNLVFKDNDVDGAYSAGDAPLPGATVGLYASNGTTLLATTTTGGGGTYLFAGLAQGDYIVKVTPLAGYYSTVDTANAGDTTNPNNNIDNNDNGVGTGAGQVSSNLITLTPGDIGASSNNTVDNSTGATTNPTLDFGFPTPPPPTLGAYPNTNVVLGGNTTVTPDAAPTDATSINVSTDTNFKGAFVASPATGVVRVTNAHPAGTYTVTVKAFGVSGLASTTFTLTVASGGACVATPSFTNKPNVAVMITPFSVVVGDFNNDGKQDIAVANVNANTISIRLGDGAGGFSGTTNVTVLSNPASVAVGDFNNDGKQDIAVARLGTNFVAIRLGDGLGGFSGTTNVPVTTYSYSVAVGDFNNDGKQDIAVANSDSNTVSIRLGDGLGGFSGTTNVTVLSRPASVAVGDFNNDGKQDIAVANVNANTISIRLGDGAGGFSGTTNVTVLSNPASVAVGDFNNDGKQDLAVAHASAGAVAIRLGDGLGGFSGPTNVPVTTNSYSVAVGDFNNDGKQDLAVANYGSSNVSIRLGNLPLCYDGNGNTGGSAPATATYAPGATVTVSGNTGSLVKTGYTFNGWNTAADGTGTHYAAGGTYTANAPLTLYAEWTPIYSIGNRVWFDTNNDGLLNGSEVGGGGVRVELYQDNGATPGVYDAGDTFVAFTTTVASGYYRFDNLPPGDYVVLIPATQFQAGGPLESYWSSGTSINGSGIPGDSIGPDPDNDTDSDDNGVTAFSGNAVNYVSSQAVTLGPGAPEPTNDNDPVTNPQVGEAPNDQSNRTVDFGFYRVAVGNLVFVDNNGNGIYDAGDALLSGATVDLYASNGTTLLTTTTTGAGGTYLFAGLAQGDYIVKVTPLAGYYSTVDTANAGDTTNPNNNIDNNDNGVGTGAGQVSSNIVTLTPGSLGAASNNTVDNSTGTTTNPTMDFGFYQPAAIGNFVWLDVGGDGIQDGGETGINGVTVTLYTCTGTPVSTTVTSGGGLYSFTGLTPGSYYVDFSLPGGYAFTQQDQGADNAVDSDADTATGQTVCTDLTSGESDNTWDAGLYQPAAIGNFVWNDLDADGIQDGGETGVAGVTVTLLDCAGNVLSTTVTNGSGIYAFTNLAPGSYNVQFTLPSSYTFSPQNQVANDAVDSDADTSTGAAICTTLLSGETDNTWDAGMYQSAEIGNFVWLDLDADGVQDGGSETGINGVTVNLHACSGGVPGGVVSTTVTSGGGLYLFSNLTPGDYAIEFVKPGGYSFSPQNVGADDSVDSDADTSTGYAACTTLISNESDVTWDAGLYQVAELGDWVWLDVDADGIQDGGETGINGVTVTLYTCAGTPVSTTVTSGGGLYSFTGLTPGSYYVDFSLPGGYAFTQQDQGADNAVDSDADTATGQTVCTDLTSGESDNTWDAGLYQPAAIGNFVWLDVGGDGIQDGGGETGVNGVTVTLYTCAGTPVSTTVTSGGGLYSFTGLTPGSYYVDFSLPGGYAFTQQDQGADNAVDSDADTTTGETICTDLTSGETDNTWDAGLYQVAELGDWVWNDLDGDGIQDGGETGVAGVTVTLLDCAGNVLSTTVTNGSGIYAFTNLIPGSYNVQFTLPSSYTFSPQNQVANDAVDSDADTATGETICTDLTSGETEDTWDAGMYLPATIGNLVWLDLDGDGIQDGGGETGIAGVTVNLLDCASNVISTTTTNGSGVYSFTNLIPGDYNVQFVKPGGYNFTLQDQGADNSVDSDANPSTGAAICTTLISGETDSTWDAGLYEVAEIGNWVWLDVGGDGIQDGGETGINGVTVTLYTCAGTPVSTTVTSGGGLYSFTGLTPGSYYVDFSLPGGYAFTQQDQSTNEAVDSDADTATGQTVCTDLTSGESDNTWDAGGLDTGAPAAGRVYLPMIVKNSVIAPDLVVDDLVATSNAVTVTIRNAGTAAVNDAFWVDVYFNPTQTPSLNHPWDTIASHGVVWGVTKSLSPGETLVLTTGGDYYFPEYSSTPPLPVGANVYALVDSVDYSTTYGAVQESNESNNLSVPVVSTASVAGKETPPVGQGQPVSKEGLPPR